MAGDWIKIEAETPDKPEIWEIAADLGIDPDAVLGKLIRVWLWFDSHTEKCNAPSVTKALLDRDVSCAGFCDSVVKSGWMVEQDCQLIIKDWWIHNGKTAKSRLLAAKRQSKLREKSNGDSVTKVTQSSLLERHLDVDVDVDVEEKELSINKQTLIDIKKKNGLVAENQETKKDRKPRVSTRSR